MIRNVPPVPVCHPDRRLHAHGLCEACYQADWRVRTGRTTRSRIVGAIEAGQDIGDRPELLGQALSPREMEALVLYGRIGSQKIVAADMGVSLQTIKNHMSSIFRKTGAVNAIAAMHTLGWIVLPTEAQIAAMTLQANVESLKSRLAAVKNETDDLLSRIAAAEARDAQRASGPDPRLSIGASAPASSPIARVA